MSTSTTARQLNIANLQELHKGRAAAAINLAIAQCVQDILEREGDDSKRKVKVIITLKPEYDTRRTGALDKVGVEFQVTTSIPAQKTQSYPMIPTKDGGLLFQPGSPFDPDQEALFGKPESETVDPVTGEVKKKK